MEKKSVYGMTEGSPAKLLLSFTIPMLIGNLFQQFYNMVDSIVVGRFVGANALAAVGATGSLNFLFFSMSFGVSAGVGVVLSQYFGADKSDMVGRSFANGMYLLALVSAIMSIVGIVSARAVLMLLNTPESILDDAVLYMRVSCAGILAIAAYNGVAAVLRALGDSRTPLYFMVVSCIINIALDLVFVIVCQWSVFGVALATVIAQLVAAIGAFIYAFCKIPILRVNKECRRVKPDIMAKCFRLGFPIALQNSLIAFSCIFLQRVVNGFGEDVVAANTALSRIEQLVQQPYNSLGAALTTFTGQNIGAGKVDRVKQGHRVGVICVIAFSILMLIPGQFFGKQIMGIFVQDADVIARGILNGAGDAAYSMINGLMEITGRVGFAKPLTMIPAIGMWGVFLTTGLTWTLVSLVSMHRYARGKWRNKAIV